MSDGTMKLFRNDKGDNPKRPDYRGDGELDGLEFKASAWISDKPAKNGHKYLNIKLDITQPDAAPSSANSADNTDADEALPF